MSKGTQAERLARLEVMTEERHQALMDALERNNPHPLVERTINKIEELDKKWTEKFEALDALVHDDIAKLAMFENRGRGIFAALAGFFAVLGATATAFWDALMKFIHS